VRAEVDRVSERLAAVRALRSAGGWKDALANVKDVVVAANALHYDPLIAEAVYEQANLEFKTGDNIASEADLLAALVTADRGHDDHTRAKALLQLVHVVGTLGRRVSEGHLYARMAEAAIARLGDPPELRADLLTQHGNVTSLEEPARAIPMMVEALALREKVYGPDDADTAIARSALGGALYEADRYDEARAELEKARAQMIRALGDQHPALAYTLMSLGNVAVQQQKLDEAQTHYEQALAIRERAMGKDSPALGGLVHNLANILFQRERYAEALPMEQRALALMEKQYGATNPVLGAPLTQLGEILIGLDDPAGAVPPLERALALRSKEGSTVAESEKARTELRLADALWDSHGDRQRARKLAATARDRWTKAGENVAVAMASKWLAERR
jgi:eukaryotic-like serine/threonine-protein kinase